MVWDLYVTTMIDLTCLQHFCSNLNYCASAIAGTVTNESVYTQTSKPFNTLENQASMPTPQQNAVKHRQSGEHTHTSQEATDICLREAGREEWVDRQQLNSHSGKREASALKQG